MGITSEGSQKFEVGNFAEGRGKPYGCSYSDCRIEGEGRDDVNTQDAFVNKVSDNLDDYKLAITSYWEVHSIHFKSFSGEEASCCCTPYDFDSLLDSSDQNCCYGFFSTYFEIHQHLGVSWMCHCFHYRTYLERSSRRGLPSAPEYFFASTSWNLPPIVITTTRVQTLEGRSIST
jgi:hypothetical protein